MAQIVGIYARCDTVSEIRDPSLGLLSTSETLAHPLDLALDRFFAPIEQIRIEVTLQGNLVANHPASLRRLNAPVQADDVVAGMLGEERKRRVRALGE